MSEHSNVTSDPTLPSDVFVHPRGLAESHTIGRGTRVWAFAHVMRGAVVGCDCNIGEGVFVESGAVLGDRVTVKNGVQIWDGVRCEDDVFVGPNATFTNDLRPRSRRPMEKTVPTRVCHGASIGANATIVAGVSIGTYALVGAGAVVVRDVPAHALVVGNPARQIRWVCRCGENLDSSLACTRCGTSYEYSADHPGLRGGESVA